VSQDVEVDVAVLRAAVAEVRRDHDGLHTVVHGNGEPGIKGRLDRVERVMQLFVWFAGLVLAALVATGIGNWIGARG
jgi:hypothetical protein